MRPCPEHSWVFPARLTKLGDGDSFWLLVDRGGRCYQEIHVRLKEVDTAEVTGPSKPVGLAAARFVAGWLGARDVWADATEGWPLRIRTEKLPDRSGRVLAWVWVTATSECLQDAIEAAGFDLTEPGGAVP